MGYGDTIQLWRREGLSDAEIGRRIGVSAGRLRQILGEPPLAGPDDNRVNDGDPSFQAARMPLGASRKPTIAS